MGRVFYTPSTQGYENEIRNDVLSRRELQIAAILEKHDFLQNSEETAVTGSKNSFEKIPGEAEHSATAKSCAKSEFGENPISQWWINEHFKSGS